VKTTSEEFVRKEHKSPNQVRGQIKGICVFVSH